MGLEINFSAKTAREELDKLKKSLKETGSGTLEVKKELESLKKTTNTLADSFKKSGNKEASESFRKLSTEIDGTISSIKVLKLSATDSSKQLGSTSSNVNKLSTAYNNAQKQIKKYETEVLKAWDTNDKYKKSLDTSEKQVKEYKTAVSNLTKTQKNNEKEILKLYDAGYKYEKKLDSLVSKNKQLGDSNRSLNGKWQTSRQEVKKLENEISKLNTEIRKSQRTSRGLYSEIDKLNRGLNKSQKEYKDALKTAKSYDRQLANAIGTIKRYEDQIKKLNARIDKMKKKNKEAAYSINKIMKAASTIRNLMFLGTMVYGIQRVSNAIITLGADFEKTMKIVGAVTQNIGKGFETTGYNQLINKALELGATTEYTSNQAAEAMKNLGLAGFNTRQILATVPGVLDLATAGQVDLATASELAVQALTAMGLKTADTAKLTENMKRVNDAFIATTTRTNTTVESIAESFKYVGQVAKNTGMEIEDLTNYLGLLGNSGQVGSMAGTQLAFALSKQNKAMEALGLNPALDSFRDVLEQINKQGWGFNDIYKIFIQRGSRAVLALKDMLPVMDRLNKLQKESSLSAEELADIYRDTVSGSLQKIRSVIENIGIGGFRRESVTLNNALKKIYKTLSDNQEDLEKLASLLVELTASVVDFGSKLIEAIPKIALFYKKNKSSIELLTNLAGLALIANGHIMTGTAMIISGITSMNIELSKESQIELITDKIKKFNDELENLKKTGKITKDVYMNMGPGLGDVIVGTEQIDATDEIKKIEKIIKKYQEEINKLQDEAIDPKYQKEKLEEQKRQERQMLDEYATQVAQNIKPVQDAQANASAKLRESKEKLYELIGADSNRLKFRGGIKIVGDLSLEDQMSKSIDEIELKIKNNLGILDKYTSDLKAEKEKLQEAEKDLFSFKGERKIGDPDFENYVATVSQIEESKKKIEGNLDAIKSLNESITRDIWRSDATEEKFNAQISKREYDRAIQAQDAIRNAEKKGYDVRKNLYNDFIQYKSSAFEKYIGKDIQDQIDAERESFERFKKNQDFLPSDQRLNESEMVRLENEMKDYFGNLEQYKTAQVELGVVERKNAEIDSQKEILQRKYDLISGFSYQVTRDQKANLQKQMNLEIQAMKNTIDAQQSIEASRMTNISIPASEKMSEDDYIKWVQENRDKLALFIKEWKKKIDDISAYTKQKLIDDFESAVDSTFSNLFSDAIKDDLGQASDYFKSFIDSLSSMWSQMASKMAISDIIAGFSTPKKTEKPKTKEAAEEAAKAASDALKKQIGMIGGMIVGGLALYTISSTFSSRQARKAEKARKEALRQQLSVELGDSLAQLKLSDTGYEIYQLNERISELTKQARSAGYPMKEIIELRKLETKAILDGVAAKYKSVTTSMTDWVTGIQRESWTVEDWKAEYNKLHEDLLNLDQSSNTYQDDSIEILEDSFSALQNIYEIQKDQLDALKSLDESLTSQIWNLQNTGKMPTSIDAYKAQYTTLLTAATPGEVESINAEAVQNFQDFTSSYLDVLSTAGYDYNTLVSQVVGDLEAVQGEVQSEMDRLSAAIDLNSTTLGTVNDSLGNVKIAIEDLTRITTDIANREVFSSWKEINPANLPNESFESVGASPADLTGSENLWVKTVPGGYGAFDAYRYLSTISNIVQSIMDWSEQIDPSISPEIGEWVKKGEGLFTLDPITNIAQLDYNKDMVFDQKDQVFIDEWFKQGNAVLDWAKEINDLNLGIQTFAKGGWNNEPSIFGETGYGEYAVPDMNNPNNSHFLKSVGVDSTEIGNAIGEIVASRIIDAMSSGNGGTTVINVDSKEIAIATVNGLKKNPQLVNYIPKRAN